MDKVMQLVDALDERVRSIYICVRKQALTLTLFCPYYNRSQLHSLADGFYSTDVESPKKEQVHGLQYVSAPFPCKATQSRDRYYDRPRSELG